MMRSVASPIASFPSIAGQITGGNLRGIALSTLVTLLVPEERAVTARLEHGRDGAGA